MLFQMLAMYLDVFCIIFADKTGLFSTIENSIPTHLWNVNEMLNRELAEVCDWLI